MFKHNFIKTFPLFGIYIFLELSYVKNNLMMNIFVTRSLYILFTRKIFKYAQKHVCHNHSDSYNH